MIAIKTLQKEYEAALARLTKLTADLKTAESAKFTSLPEQVGLKTVDALIKALIPHASGATRAKLRGAYGGRESEPTQKRAKPAKSRRGRLDTTAKEQIISALKEREKTAAAIAADFGVSVATINIMKAKAGLTKKRKK